MALVVTDSIILQVFPYGDTSKILRLLTATHGLRSVMAKGALRPRSRFGGILEAFAVGSATLHVKDGRELQTLAGFDLTRSHQRLGSDLLRFGGASLIAEIALRTGSEEAQPRLFEQVRRTIGGLQDSDVGGLESVVLAGAWSLIATLGFAPELDACLDCGRSLEPAEETRFDYAAGGVHCAACADGAPGRSLPPHARNALSRLVRGQTVPLERTEGHWRLLSMYLDHHVLEGGALRSMGFLAATLQDGRCAG